MNPVSASFAHQPFPTFGETAIKAETGNRIISFNSLKRKNQLHSVVHRGITLGILGGLFVLWREMKHSQKIIKKQDYELSILKTATDTIKSSASKSAQWNKNLSWLPGIFGTGMGTLGLISAKNSERAINGLTGDLANARYNHNNLSSEVNTLRRNGNLGLDNNLRTDVINLRHDQSNLREEVNSLRRTVNHGNFNTGRNGGREDVDDLRTDFRSTNKLLKSFIRLFLKDDTNNEKLKQFIHDPEVGTEERVRILSAIAPVTNIRLHPDRSSISFDDEHAIFYDPDPDFNQRESENLLSYNLGGINAGPRQSVARLIRRLHTNDFLSTNVTEHDLVGDPGREWDRSTLNWFLHPPPA